MAHRHEVLRHRYLVPTGPDETAWGRIKSGCGNTLICEGASGTFVEIDTRNSDRAACNFYTLYVGSESDTRKMVILR